MHKLWRTVAVLVTAALFASLASVAVAGPPAQAQACTELVTNGGFETTDGWEFGAGPVPPQYVSDPVHSGARSLQLGITSSSNVQSYSSARQTLTIPAGATQVTLSYWYYTRFAGSTAADYAELAFLSPDGSVVLAKPWSFTTDSPVWQQIAFDLSGWQGKTFQIYFNVYNDGAGGQAALFVDDVSLSACSPAPATVTPVATPTFVPTAIPTAVPTATPTLVPTTAPASAPLAVAPSPTPGCTELIRNGSFTAGLGDWQIVGNPSAVALATDRYQSAPYALKLGSLDVASSGLAGAQQQVTIPANSPIVDLNVRIFNESQPAAGADYQEIALLNSSGGLLFVPYRGPANEGDWIQLEFNLAAFAGQTVYLRFAVNNDGSGGNTDMYVDDVRLTACSAGAQPVPAPSATPTLPPLPTLVSPELPSENLPQPQPPVSPALPPGCAELTQNGGFEAGLAGWIPGANPLPPAIVNSPVFAGTYAVQLGTRDQNLNSYSSIRQTVSVPYGFARTVVSFWTYTWAEQLTGADRQEFVLLGPGNVVWAVPWKVLENTQTWQQHMFELVGAAGQTFDLYFAAINDGAGGRTALYLDDVHLWGCGATLPVTAPQEEQGAVGAAQAEPPLGAEAPLIAETPLPVETPLTPQAVPVPQIYPIETMPPAAVAAMATAIGTQTPVLPFAEWTEVAIVTPSIAELATAVGGPAGGAGPLIEGTLPPPEITIPALAGLGTVVAGTPAVSISVSLTPQPASFLSDIASRLPTGGKLAVIGLVILLVILLVIALLRGRSAPVE